MYCHNAKDFTCSSRDTWGVPSELLSATEPNDPVLGRALPEIIRYTPEGLIGKEIMTKRVLWPLLYFHGDDSCHVLINNPSISKVNLTASDDPSLSTQVHTGGCAVSNMV